MTQEALVVRLQRAGWDVSRTSLAKIEAQIRWVTDCELFVLAKVLEVSLSDLFPAERVVTEFVRSPNFKRN